MEKRKYIKTKKILFFANTDWYLYNFRLKHVKTIQSLGIEVVLVSPPGQYGSKLREEGFRWIPINMNRRSLNPWSETKLLIEIIRLYRKEKVDLAHHFTIKPVVYGALASRLSGVKCTINAVVGLGYVFISQSVLARILRPLVRLLLRLTLNDASSRLILQNKDDFHYFRNLRIVPSEHIKLIRGSGADTSKFHPANRKRNPDGRFRVLMATRLLWDKGVKEYVDAARILRSNNRSIDFLIAGAPDEGNPASVQHDVLAMWAKEGIVTSLGHVHDMPSLLSEVELVVLPSYREGTPRILLEAAAAGLPIVATDVPGCREIVEHGKNGLLVPAMNDVALAAAIEYLSAMPRECERMGAEGRKKVLDEFDERYVIRKTLAVYRELQHIPKIRFS